jgi:putative SOS response-associated peptidase YedK
MCCRYFVSEESNQEIRKLAGTIDPSAAFPTGDIHPSDRSTILTGRKPGILAEDMRWGFPSYDLKLLINARSETVFEKKSFADSMRWRRCVIAAEHFYEWDEDRQIVSFLVPDRKVICMAGIWNAFGKEDRFTVLTREANDSMKPVHNRMPLILDQDRISDWLYDNSRAGQLLACPQPKLEMINRAPGSKGPDCGPGSKGNGRKAEAEGVSGQMSIFDFIS